MPIPEIITNKVRITSAAQSGVAPWGTRIPAQNWGPVESPKEGRDVTLLSQPLFPHV